GELEGELDRAWCTCPLHSSEVGAVSDVAVRILELCRVEQVEEFRTEFHVDPLGQTRVLLHGEVPILDTVTATDRPLGSTKRAEGCRRVSVRIECVETGLARYSGRAAGANRAESIVTRIAGREVPGQVRLAG